MRERFHHFCSCITDQMGAPWAFIAAVVLILGWVLTGPFVNSSNTWQLVFNTSPTIVTFLMVFLIQNTQNRDAKAIHLKLDELLRGVDGARSRLIKLEELSDEELEKLKCEFEQMSAAACLKSSISRK